MDINIQNLTKQQILTGYRNGTIKPANDGKYWTEEDRLQLVSMYRGGVCISDMAIHFERKERGITQQLEVLGEITVPPRPKPSQNKQAVCLCGKCQVKNCIHRTSTQEDVGCSEVFGPPLYPETTEITMSFPQISSELYGSSDSI